LNTCSEQPLSDRNVWNTFQEIKDSTYRYVERKSTFQNHQLFSVLFGIIRRIDGSTRMKIQREIS